MNRKKQKDKMYVRQTRQSLFLQRNNVAVEKQIILACVRNLSDPACTAHVPYYIVICDLPDCTIF